MTKAKSQQEQISLQNQQMAKIKDSAKTSEEYIKQL